MSSRSWYCLAICDLDFFKRYNDSFGHLAGDEALRRVAGALAGASRSQDGAYRYGGEEFVLLMPNTSRDTGMIAVERLRQAIEDVAIPHEHSPLFEVVTISSGIAASDPDDRYPPDTLLAQADAALYRSKAEGRNRTTASETRHVERVA